MSTIVLPDWSQGPPAAGYRATAVLENECVVWVSAVATVYEFRETNADGHYYRDAQQSVPVVVRRVSWRQRIPAAALMAGGIAGFIGGGVEHWLFR